MHRYKAILLIGPTGSGKTPLGAVCQQKGLWSRTCRHFDFGDQLRRIAARPIDYPFLSEKNLNVIRNALATGALLENEHFHIAEKILLAFVRKNACASSDLILLNGLPRHLSQAEDVDRIVAIDAVILLACRPQTVRQRIRANTGGDREKRTDDSETEITLKLKLFQERTVALLDHYRRKDIPVITVTVDVKTRSDEIHRRLETSPP